MDQKTYIKIQKNFQPGEVIFEDGAASDGMYIIQSGCVSVYKTVHGPTGSKQIELTKLGAKGMFGEMALIGENTRSASAKAIEPTVVTVVTPEMLNDQLSRLPAWVLNIIKLLSNRLRATNKRLQLLQEQNLNHVSSPASFQSLPQHSNSLDVDDEEEDLDDDFEDDEEEKDDSPEIEQNSKESLSDSEEDEEEDEDESNEVENRDTENTKEKKKESPGKQLKNSKLSAERDALLKNLDF